MNLKELADVLKNNPDSLMHWMLPGSSFVPDHYHITEIGRVKKDFFDCGGTARSTEACVLQIWVANDVEHRLKTDKLLKIIDVADKLLTEDLSVEVEYEEGDTISYYSLGNFEPTPKGPLFYLTSKHTTCLAPDKCKVNVCSPGGGCC